MKTNIPQDSAWQPADADDKTGCFIQLAPAIYLITLEHLNGLSFLADTN